MTSHDMLEAWAARIQGSTLKDPRKKSTGGGSTYDDETAVVLYVETTAGFHVAEMPLKHVHVHGLRLADFRARYCFETRWMALKRLEWLPFRSLSDRRIAELVYGQFVQELEARLIAQPFTYPERKEDHQEVVRVAVSDQKVVKSPTW